MFYSGTRRPRLVTKQCFSLIGVVQPNVWAPGLPTGQLRRGRQLQSRVRRQDAWPSSPRFGSWMQSVFLSLTPLDAEGLFSGPLQLIDLLLNLGAPAKLDGGGGLQVLDRGVIALGDRQQGLILQTGDVDTPRRRHSLRPFLCHGATLLCLSKSQGRLHSPARISGSDVPFPSTPSISSWPDPIMKSTCVALMLPPARANSSSLI
jgi:hypothetical protein